MTIVKRKRKAQHSQPIPGKVQELYDHGIASVIPLFKGKSPGYDSWNEMDESEAQQKFWSWQEKKNEDPEFDGQLNYGIRLGPSYGDVVDIDLDSDTARGLAPYYLPPTSTFGRASKGTTHYLYKQMGAGKATTQKLLWPEGTPEGETKTVIMEFRANGQTMGPGSIHPSTGEPIEWTSDVPMLGIKAEALQVAFLKLAAACVLLNHWEEGCRDELALALCGAMLRTGKSPEEVDAFLHPILEVSGDENPEKRLKADRVAELLKGTARVPGIPRLMEILGDRAGKAVVKWLNLGSLNVIEELNKNFAVSMLNGSAVIIREVRDLNDKVTHIQLLNKESLALLMSNRVILNKGKEVTVDKVWLSAPERRQYLGGIVFYPEWGGGKPNPEQYNLWHGFAVEESAEGSWDKFRMHLFTELCRGSVTEFNWVLQWMAHRVQRPWEVPRSAIVMMGARGTGKGTIANCFGRLFGDHYMTVTQVSQFLGRFNSHLLDKVLVFADEAVWGGDKQNEGVLKVLISEDKRNIEFKGKDTLTVNNCTGYMVASNEDWVVPVGPNERRFYVTRLTGAHIQDHDYFSEIRDELEMGGYERMLYDLRRIDISEWRGDQPPKTQFLTAQASFNLEPDVRFLQYLLSSKNPEDDLVIAVNEFTDEYLRFVKARLIKYFPSEAAMVRKAKEIFPEMSGPVRRRRTRSGDRVRVYDLGTYESARSRLNDYLGMELDYGD